MLFKRLHQLVHLFEYQSSSLAAEALGLPKSTLSASCSQLEETLGCRLFRRYAYGVRPLQTAWDLYASAEETLARLQILEATFAGHGALSSPRPLLVKCPQSMTAGQWYRAIRNASWPDRDGRAPFIILSDRRADAPNIDGWQNPAYAIDVEVETPPNGIDLAPFGWVVVSMEQMAGRSRGEVISVSELTGRRLAVPLLGAREWAAFQRGVGTQLSQPPVRLDRPHWDLASYLALNPSVGIVMPEYAVLPALEHAPFQTMRLVIDAPPPLLCLTPHNALAETHEELPVVAAQLQQWLAHPPQAFTWTSPLSYKEIRYFETAYESLSISEAARRLYVVQPAISKKLIELETKLDQKLFVRSRAGLDPLPAARLLHQTSGRLADLAASIVQRSATPAENKGVILSISCLPPYDESSFLATALRDTLMEWNHRYPLIRLSTLEGLSRKQHSWLQEGRVCAAIVESLFDTNHLVVTPLRQDPLVVLFGQGYDPSELPDEIPVASLPDYRLILPSRSHGIRTTIDRQLENHDIVVTPELEIDSLAAISVFVNSGRYATIMPDIGRLRDADTAGLHKRPISGGRLVRSLYLLHPDESTFSFAEKKAVELLVKHFGSEVPANAASA